MSNALAEAGLALSGLVAYAGFVIVVDEGVDRFMDYLARRHRADRHPDG